MSVKLAMVGFQISRLFFRRAPCETSAQVVDVEVVIALMPSMNLSHITPIPWNVQIKPMKYKRTFTPSGHAVSASPNKGKTTPPPLHGSQIPPVGFSGQIGSSKLLVAANKIMASKIQKANTPSATCLARRASYATFTDGSLAVSSSAVVAGVPDSCLPEAELQTSSSCGMTSTAATSPKRTGEVSGGDTASMSFSFAPPVPGRQPPNPGDAQDMLASREVPAGYKVVAGTSVSDTCFAVKSCRPKSSTTRTKPGSSANRNQLPVSQPRTTQPSSLPAPMHAAERSGASRMLIPPTAATSQAVIASDHPALPPPGWQSPASSSRSSNGYRGRSWRCFCCRWSASAPLSNCHCTCLPLPPGCMPSCSASTCGEGLEREDNDARPWKSSGGRKRPPVCL
mmetsp:Transcript_93186/g.268217  ORF Transcript_93186/g.268217 Transcript_93186/m.268217 type:complete len:397 (-) Transcript_93186:827-2017(-)